MTGFISWESPRRRREREELEFQNEKMRRVIEKILAAGGEKDFVGDFWNNEAVGVSGSLGGFTHWFMDYVLEGPTR